MIQNPDIILAPQHGNNSRVQSMQLSVMNMVPPTEEQLGELSHCYAAHRTAVRNSLAGFITSHGELPDGSKYEIVTNSGMTEVMLWPVGGSRESEQLPPLWVLVNVKLIDGDLNTNATTEVRSFLYRIPEGLDLKKATLEYSGTTTGSLTYAIDPVTGSTERHGSFADVSGAMGCLTGFAPYGKKVVLHADRAQFDASFDSPTQHSFTEATRTHKLKFKEFEEDYLLHYVLETSGPSGSPTYHQNDTSGIYVDSWSAMVLEPGKANFTIREVSGLATDHRGSGTWGYTAGEPPKFMRVDLSEEPSIEEDPAPPTVAGFGILAPRDPAYGRKELWRNAQGPNAVLHTPPGDPSMNRLYNRTFTSYLGPLNYSPNVIFYAQDLLLRPLAPSAGALRVAAVTLNNKTLKTLNLSELPELAEDSIFSAFAAGFDTVDIGGFSSDRLNVSSILIPEFQPHLARTYRYENNLLQYRKASDLFYTGERVEVSIVLLPDPKVIWSET